MVADRSGGGEFLRELAELTGLNVLLLLINGALVFGRIGHVSERAIRVLPPAGIAGLTQAVFRPPGTVGVGTDVLAGEVILDEDVVAQALSGNFTAAPITVGPQPLVRNVFRPRIFEPHGYCELIERIIELEELEGQNVVLRTRGGWAVGGQLGETRHCVVRLGPATATLPPFIIGGAITVFGPALPPAGLILTGPFQDVVDIRWIVRVDRP